MKEEEIRPQVIFNEYLRLAKMDVKTYFKKSATNVIPCPACKIPASAAFKKNGFIYSDCKQCNTLFVNPRPEASSFMRYYRESPSSRFWSTTFYKETAVNRKEKLWKPKAKKIKDLISKYITPFPSNLVDVGGGYGIFAEVYRELTCQEPLVIEPSPGLASVCRTKSLNVIEKFLEEVSNQDLDTGTKTFVSFELFEHLHDPEAFVKKLFDLMNSGDLFIFTTLSSLGLDIQVLWEQSKSVNPPHHLNFFNPRSIKILVERCGLEILEINTPGELDINILENNLDKVKDRFWRHFIASCTQQEKKEMQQFIVSLNLSSHMWVVCKKK